MMGTSPLSSEPLARLRARHLVVPARPKSLPLGLGPIDALLPDAGLPRGAVVEICSPAGLGHATRLALAACASAQREARAQSACAWCGWIDTSRTLFAPGVLAAGVDLERLLVVRPPPEALARIAVRLGSSQLFSLLVVERAGVPGMRSSEVRARWSTTVRRLGLAVESSECTVVLLSSTEQLRAEPLPVAMRIELGRPSSDRLSFRIAKERYGRVGDPVSLSLSEVA
jgi:recombination protein RecA